MVSLQCRQGVKHLILGLLEIDILHEAACIVEALVLLVCVRKRWAERLGVLVVGVITVCVRPGGGPHLWVRVREGLGITTNQLHALQSHSAHEHAVEARHHDGGAHLTSARLDVGLHLRQPLWAVHEVLCDGAGRLLQPPGPVPHGQILEPALHRVRTILGDVLHGSRVGQVPDPGPHIEASACRTRARLAAVGLAAHEGGAIVRPRTKASCTLAVALHISLVEEAFRPHRAVGTVVKRRRLLCVHLRQEHLRYPLVDFHAVRHIVEGRAGVLPKRRVHESLHHRLVHLSGRLPLEHEAEDEEAHRVDAYQGGGQYCV
mmetsp:Transcript_109003/g.314844  ORF Transcript_109003/g.314844 Transcript_109003/m.314844 type:complete len:318 (+) Transcript_109003:4521-5474(+)